MRSDSPAAHPRGFRVAAWVQDDVYYVQPHGELDLVTAAQLEQELTRSEETSVAAIELDLRQLTFMDASGIHLLLRARDRTAADANRLVIIPPAGQPARLIAICGIEATLPFASRAPRVPALQLEGDGGPPRPARRRPRGGPSHPGSGQAAALSEPRAAHPSGGASAARSVQRTDRPS